MKKALAIFLIIISIGTVICGCGNNKTEENNEQGITLSFIDYIIIEERGYEGKGWVSARVSPRIYITPTVSSYEEEVELVWDMILSTSPGDEDGVLDNFLKSKGYNFFEINQACEKISIKIENNENCSNGDEVIISVTGYEDFADILNLKFKDTTFSYRFLNLELESDN